MRKREKSIPRSINFDGNLTIFLLYKLPHFVILIRNFTVYDTHTDTKSIFSLALALYTKEIWEKERNMAENQTPHPDYILGLLTCVWQGGRYIFCLTRHFLLFLMMIALDSWFLSLIRIFMKISTGFWFFYSSFVESYIVFNLFIFKFNFIEYLIDKLDLT